MAYRLCKHCKSIIEDSSECSICQSDESILMDELISLKGVEYDFQQDKKDTKIWKVVAPGKSYICVVDESGSKPKIECDCRGYSFRKYCKHSTALGVLLASSGKQVTTPLYPNPSPPTYIKKRYKRDLIKKLLKNLDKDVLRGIKYEAAGSYRREAPDSKDIDIVVLGLKKKVIESRLRNLYPTGGDKRPGDTVTHAGVKGGNIILRWYVPIDGTDEIMVDFTFTTKVEYEPMLLFFTGSKRFNINLRGKAKSMGFALNRYGLWDRNNPETLIARTERDIFKALKMPYIDPKSR